MEEHTWKMLSGEIPLALLRLATSDEALESLDGALAELDVRVLMARELCLGPMADALAVHARGPRPDGITPADLLRDALAEMRMLSEAHGGVARDLDKYRDHVGDAVEDALGEAIDAHRSEAARAAGEALDYLLAAATHSEAASDFYAVAQGLPYESPLWDGWTATAENLARLALQEATAARGAVTRMLHGVTLHFFDSWTLLKVAEKEPWKRLARSVPPTLELVASLVGVMEDLRSLQSRIRKLSDQVSLKTTGTSAASELGSSAFSVIAVLEAAHREITRVMALHAAAGRVFALSAIHLDVDCDTVQTWDSHRSDAVRAGHETMRQVACVASAWMAFDSMFSVAKFRNAEAGQLLRRARLCARRPAADARRYRHAVLLRGFLESPAHCWRLILQLNCYFLVRACPDMIFFRIF